MRKPKQKKKYNHPEKKKPQTSNAKKDNPVQNYLNSKICFLMFGLHFKNQILHLVLHIQCLIQ